MRIGLQHLGIQLRRLVRGFRGCLLIEMTGQQVLPVGVRIGGPSRGEFALRLGRKLYFQRLGNRARDVLLKSNGIAGGSIEARRPLMETVMRVDELHGDADMIIEVPDRSFEKVSRVEHLADLAHILISPLEGKCGGSRHDAQSRNLRQPVGQFLREAVA